MDKHITVASVLTGGLTNRSLVELSMAKNLIRLLGPVRISRLNPDRIRAYRAAREAEGTSPSTRNRELGVLRALLHQAASEGRLRRESLPTFWGQEAEPLRDRVISQDEQARLLAELSGWQKDTVIVLIETGARASEVLKAQVSDITPGDGGGYLLVKNPKEGQPKRLRLRNGAWEAILRLLDGRTEGRLVRGCGSPSGCYKPLQRSLYAACRRAGIPAVHLHDLRRTMGTRLAGAGAPAYIISGLLGHTSERTLRHYVRLSGAQYDGWLDRVQSP